MKYYYFYQLYENHFETAAAKDYTYVSLTAFFFKNNIFSCQQQHNTKINGDKATLPNWEKLKAFFQKNSRESTVFVYIIQTKIKKDSKYQLEEVQDQVIYFKHLQSILKNFDTNYIQLKALLSQYFYKNLRPSIKLKID